MGTSEEIIAAQGGKEDRFIRQGFNASGDFKMPEPSGVDLSKAQPPPTRKEAEEILAAAAAKRLDLEQ